MLCSIVSMCIFMYMKTDIVLSSNAQRTAGFDRVPRRSNSYREPLAGRELDVYGFHPREFGVVTDIFIKQNKWHNMQEEIPWMTADSQITCFCARSLRSINGDSSVYLRLFSYALLLLNFWAVLEPSWYSSESLYFVKILSRIDILAGAFCCIVRKRLFSWFVIRRHIFLSNSLHLFARSQLSKS